MKNPNTNKATWLEKLPYLALSKDVNPPEWLKPLLPLTLEELAVVYFLNTQWDMSVEEAIDDKDSHSLFHGTPYDVACFEDCADEQEDYPFDNDFHIFSFAGETWTIYLNQ